MDNETRINAIKRKFAVKIKIAQREAAKEMASLIVEMIKLRTRFAGQGTNGDLKELSESYIKQRRGELSFFTTPDGKKIPYKPKKKPLLHPDTSPSESNLTATGQMLDALKGKSVDTKATVIIAPTKRKKELSGAKSKLNNDQVRKYVEDGGREFLKLSPDERDEAIDMATQILKDKLSSLLK
jgi:hypothetical protein